jgi:small subunit ribosomal protein S4
VRVNGRRVTIPSFRIKVGDAVEVKDKQLALVPEATAQFKRGMPDYITSMSTKMTRVPTLSEVPNPVMMEPHLVAEYYSR